MSVPSRGIAGLQIKESDVRSGMWDMRSNSEIQEFGIKGLGNSEFGESANESIDDRFHLRFCSSEVLRLRHLISVRFVLAFVLIGEV
jgi:hypothetical protein